MIEIIPNWHPIFVHFTVALLSVSMGLFVVAQVVKCDQAILVAKWNLWIGAGVSLLTLAAGVYAYNTVAHDTPSHEAMTEHRNLALITLALLVPVVVWSVKAHRQGKTLGLGFVALFLVVGGLLGSTAWHGGEVVYRYGLGVMSLPKTDSHDHAGHEHDGGADHVDAGHDDGHAHDHAASESNGMMNEGMEMNDMNMEELNMEELNMDEMSMESMPQDDHPDDGHDHKH